MNYDIIIIGAGLSGLTAGAKLSKEGKKVLLVEQHSIPGGCATTFKRKDYWFEVGLHEMDGFHDKDMKSKIFRDLGVFDHVTFIEVPEFYRFAYKDYNIVIPHDAEKAKEVLIKNFPDEKAGIDAYFYQLMNAREIIKKSADKQENNVGDFLDSIIKNEDLKLALLGNLGYFHDDPYSLALSYYSVAQGSYYTTGGFFVKGGSQQLSDYLAKVITDNGGDVVYSHLVNSIIVENDKAVGITFQKKGSDETKKAFGNYIISNAAIPNVAAKLLPEKYRAPLQKEVDKRRAGSSFLTIYFGFNKPLKTIGNKNYSSFIFDDTIDSIGDIARNNKGDFEHRSYTFIDYGQIDSGLAPAGKSVGAICCTDYLNNWENLEEKEYYEQKEKVARIFIDKLEKLIPGVKDSIEHYEVATSKTIQRYTLNPHGTAYGFAQTPESFRLGPIESVDSLSFASAWTKVGGGFSGAIYNGYLRALDVIRKSRA